MRLINNNKCLSKHICLQNIFLTSVIKVKLCYNPLRLGTVIVLVSSGVDFVNTPLLYNDRATR